MDGIKEESFGIVPLRYSGSQWHVFLILHKQGEHWAFPKGRAHEGEDPKESASRELFEETGLTVEQFLTDKPLTEDYTFFRPKEKVHKKVSYFPAIVSGDFCLQAEEIRDGKWLTLEEAKKQLTFEEAKKICSQVQKLLHA